jgi:hypothetical protein
MLIVQASRSELYIIGSGLAVSFARDPDVDARIAGIESVDKFLALPANGPRREESMAIQTNRGRQLLMDTHRPRIYRVQL